MPRIPAAIRERAHAVGGVVRDALLDLPPGRDLDLVVEGALDPGPDWSAHDRFGTAIKVFPEGTLHVGATRVERYPSPGALPDVAEGTLDDDLARRDVTVNAMAFPLFGVDAGRLIDNHGGLGDLRARVMRILRPDAFVEDPSRLVRVARYAARLGFSVEPSTEAAARAAAPALDPANSRVAGEVRRVLEEDAAGALRLLADLGVPWVGDPSALAVIDGALAEHGIPDVAPWAARLAAAVAPDAAEIAALPGWAVATARELRRGAEVAAAIHEGAAPSAWDRALAALRPAGVVGALATGRPEVARWWRNDRLRRADIDGSDLVRAGIAPGPAIGRALAAVRAAILDGGVGTRDSQLDLALRVAREEP